MQERRAGHRAWAALGPPAPHPHSLPQGSWSSEAEVNSDCTGHSRAKALLYFSGHPPLCPRGQLRGHGVPSKLPAGSRPMVKTPAVGPPSPGSPLSWPRCSGWANGARSLHLSPECLPGTDQGRGREPGMDPTGPRSLPGPWML